MRYGIGFLCSVALSPSLLLACSGVDGVSIPRAESSDPSPVPTNGSAHDAGGTRDSGNSVVDAGVALRDAGPPVIDASLPDADPAPAPPVMPTLAQILAITSKCNVASNGG